MAKYRDIASGLPRKPEPFQDAVTAAKRLVVAQTPAELASQLVTIRAARADAKEALSLVNVSLVAVEQLLVDAFEAAGVTSLVLDSGESLSTQIKPYARVEDKHSFRAWCVREGLSDALALPWQTTNSLVSERLLEGLPEPDGVSTFKQTTVVVRGPR
jgi:hypothetical protein